ncbi:polyhydroxyalkanoic acid system family protein [Pleionea mediterranea]|uniref:Putative polyhydroxyalkanoate system protein n=1 Tax=Pleionea mediterranea TaxID=523701 RepID=A0A316FHI6_9GAMM|nr:polyhydroxyalkanoic acid system family protein [Pleionea mediterranea]PWK47899.1 putative polyhydroxyalkanoate system protein [Pleionea mediterranea]
MPDIQLSQPHQLTQQQARAKVDKMTHQLESDLGLTIQWLDDDKLSFERSGANGVLTLTEQQVSVEVKLNFMLRAMKGTIEKELEKALRKAFG